MSVDIYKKCVCHSTVEIRNFHFKFEFFSKKKRIQLYLCLYKTKKKMFKLNECKSV